MMLKRSPLAITKAVVFALFSREMQGRLNARRLGTFWLLFEPIFHVAGIIFLIGVVRGRTLPGFDMAVFLVQGIVPFLLMKNIALRMMEAVSANKALFSYRQIKPLDAYVARALLECAVSITVYLLLIAVLGFFFNYDVTIARPLEWAGAWVLGITFSFFLGIIFSVIGEFFPEIKTLFRMSFLALYVTAGVIYPIWTIPDFYRQWITWNPFLHLIDGVRLGALHWYPDLPDLNLEYPAALTLVLGFVAMALYRAKRLRLISL